MAKFPEDLFGRAEHGIHAKASLAEKGARFEWFPDPLSTRLAHRCISILNQHMSKVMKEYRSRIPRNSISRMSRNYDESLGKTFSNRTAFLNSNRSQASRVAEEIGLLVAMRSAGALRLAERLSGYKLLPDPGCQVICYEEGDHAGPHNDHHPEDNNLRNGYVDLHLTLCEPAVDHQFFVYEHGGYLSECRNVAARSGISISHLPFWHYVTPLALKDSQKTGRRWLILCSYEKALNEK
jgi:hypothetical protein